MAGADATGWASTASSHRYSGFAQYITPEFIVCGRCGAVLINGNTNDQYGNIKNCVQLHDDWHNSLPTLPPSIPQVEDIMSLVGRLRPFLPGLIQDIVPPMVTASVVEILKQLAEMDRATPIEHEPGPTLPGVKRAQPDFTVLKES